MKVTIPPVLLLSLTLTAPASIAWAAPAPQEPDAVRDTGGLELGLVDSDTWLYAAPDVKAHRFRIKRRLPSMKRAYKKAIFPLYATARPRRVMVFQLVGALPEGKGYAHLRPVSADLAGVNSCGFLTPGRDLEVDLYVRAKDLLTTLKQPFLANFEEGTGVELEPGVVIRPTKNPKRSIAETPHLQVELALTPGITARSFRPREPFATSQAAAWAKGPIKLTITKDIRAKLFGVDIGLQATPVKRGHGRWLMRQTSACAKVIGIGRYRPLDREPGPSLGGALGKYSDRATLFPKGTQVFWPDGRAAGRTAGRMGFEPKQRVKTRLADRACFKHTFFADEKQVLCFPASPPAAP